MNLPPYPKYKPSGVEWLGDVPEHWEVKAIKWESPVLRGASPRPIDDPKYFDDDEGEFAWVRISDVTSAGRYLEVTEQKLSRLGSSLSVKLEPGKLFLSIAGSVGKPCVTRIKCCIHDGFVHFPRWKSDPTFLYYIFASGEPYLGLGKMGTQLNLNTDTVGSIVIGLPAPDEQHTINSFLDERTGKLDALAEKKRALIEKLKEKRSALISRTVTKGLPAAAAAQAGLPTHPKFKPSGIDWLGDIPEHWEVLKWRRLILSLKDFGSNGSFAGLRENVEYLHNPDYAQLIRLTDLRKDLENENAIYVSEESYRYLRHSVLKGGEFLIANVGAHAGLVLEMPKIDRPSTLGPNMMFAKKINETKVSSRYLVLSAQGRLISGQLRMIATGSSAQPKLNKDDVRSVVTPLPPLPEQTAIADYLDRETAKIDRMISKVEAALEKLAEYRTALITAAVTGKIDVRRVSV